MDVGTAWMATLSNHAQGVLNARPEYDQTRFLSSKRVKALVRPI
jgi:hypothetical protein